MSSEAFGKAFRIVVSDKKENSLGIGGTAHKTARSIYFYASREEDGPVLLQALNGNDVPAGETRTLTLMGLLEGYRPEPLYYYNKVKPALDVVEADLERGEKNLEDGRADLAEKCFKRALDVDAENIRGIFGLGTAYLEAGKSDEAEEILGRIMNLEMAFAPEHAHLFNRFGIRLRKAGLFPQALGYYRKAAALNARDEHLQFNICRIHYEMDDLGSAMACVTQALDLNPDFKEGALMREHLLRRMTGKDESGREGPCRDDSDRDVPSQGGPSRDIPGQCLPGQDMSSPGDREAGPSAGSALDYEGLDLDDLPWETG